MLKLDNTEPNMEAKMSGHSGKENSEEPNLIRERLSILIVTLACNMSVFSIACN